MSIKSVKSDTYSHTTLVEEQVYNDKNSVVKLPKISVTSMDFERCSSIDEAREDVSLPIKQVTKLSQE